MKFEAKLKEIRALLSELEYDIKLPSHYLEHVTIFFESYLKVLESKGEFNVKPLNTFYDFLSQVKHLYKTPFTFSIFHQKVTQPFDFYQLGLDFIEPLIDFKDSTLTGHSELEKIERYLEADENVVFLANHQIEADPQVIALMLKDKYPLLTEKLIFVAGAKVTSDLLAIPFSMGCNLLCIHSKKYINIPPEQKEAKQDHNKKTMRKMSELFSEGGHAIYVAPSGGRDRCNEAGEITVASFDPKSVEMFFLMGKKAARKTHFFPMALATFHLLPPPEGEKHELGEERVTKGGPVHLTILPEIAPDNLLEKDPSLDKEAFRQKKIDLIHSKIVNAYKQFPN